MYTLIYMDGHFNGPENLESFIMSNVREYPLLRIDCLTPFKGSKQDIIHDVCKYLGCIIPQYEVSYSTTQNVSIEDKNGQLLVHFLTIQISQTER